MRVSINRGSMGPAYPDSREIGEGYTTHILMSILKPSVSPICIISGRTDDSETNL